MDIKYEPNSFKSKEERAAASKENEPKLEKAVTGPVKVRKKNEVQKFADSFLSEDVSNIKSYVISEVLVPAAKKVVSDTIGGIADIIRDSVNVCLYGEAEARRKRRDGSGSKFSYEKCYDKSDSRPVIGINRGKQYDDVVLDSRGEAEQVLDCLGEYIDKYEFASIADLNELLGISSTHADRNYGWTDIRNASVVRVRDGYGYGYVLKLPRALPREK